jgi:hypothetical protein
MLPVFLRGSFFTLVATFKSDVVSRAVPEQDRACSQGLLRNISAAVKQQNVFAKLPVAPSGTG